MHYQKFFPLLLATRFIRSSSNEKSLSLMIRVCFISILVATFALTLVAAIMNGFEKATHAKLKSIHADGTLTSRGHALDYSKLSQVLKQEFKDSILAASPVAFGQLLIKATTKHATPQLIALKGIDATLEAQVSTLHTMLLHSKPTWISSFSSHGLVIGNELAQQLGVTLGDTVILLLPEDDQVESTKITLSTKEATITNIFKTGINEFDEHVAYCSLDFFKQLFNTGITQVNLALADHKNENLVLQALTKRLGLEAYSWKDLYPALVSALTLEKYAMWVILTLVTIVASMNIVALLFMYITQKQRDIAILKAMGMHRSSLQLVFIILGMGITLTATT
ncbi:ABC transporter permease, partial [Candidatus Dependentiae bacterium]|nr:ABC transporter permease [Candidatus Dependentiae bacterium]